MLNINPACKPLSFGTLGIVLSKEPPLEASIKFEVIQKSLLKVYEKNLPEDYDANKPSPLKQNCQNS